MKILFVLSFSVSSTFAFVQPTRSFSRPHFELRRNDEAVLSPGSDTGGITNSDSVFSFTSSFSEEKFLQDIEQQKQDLDFLSQQYAALHDLNLVASRPANDYMQSVTRLSRLAIESSAKYNPELVLLGFQEKKIKKSTGTLNESSKAFMLLAVAVAAATLATNSPTVIEQLSTFDIPPSLKFDGLPISFELPEVNTEFIGQLGVQAATMKYSMMEKLSDLPSHKLGAAPMRLDFNSDEFIEPLRSNIATMKESVMEQTSQALDAMKGTKTTVLSSLHGWWNNAQVSTSSQINVVKDAIQREMPVLQQSLNAQVEGAQATTKDLQTSMTLQLQTIQDNVPGYVSSIKTSLTEQTSSAQDAASDMQATVATKAIVVQGELARMADNVKVGLFAFMENLRAIVEDAQYTLRASTTILVNDQIPEYVNSAKENFAAQTSDVNDAVKEMQGSIKTAVRGLQDQRPAYLSVIKGLQSSVGFSVDKFEMPEIPEMDASTFSTLAKQIQAAIGAKATSIELPQIVLSASAAEDPREALASFDIYQSSTAIEEFFRNR